MLQRRWSAGLMIAAALFAAWITGATAQSRPADEVVWAWHVTIAPGWFDPADAPALITPFGVLFALHDALVRPLPGERRGNSLAATRTESPDGLVYTFNLRDGLRFLQCA